MTLILAVVALKGGVGKTTTAVHFAQALAETHAPVVLADADPQGSALRWLDAAGGLPGVLAAGAASLEALRSLRTLADGAAAVVIDTPPGHIDLTRAAIEAADVAIVVVRPTLLDLERLLPTLDLVAQAGTPGVILLAQARARTKTLSAARSALDRADLPVLATAIPLREAVAVAYGLATTPEALAVHREALAELLGALHVTTKG